MPAHSRCARRSTVCPRSDWWARRPRAHRASQNETCRLLGTAWNDNDLVFPGERGAPISDKPIRRIFRRACLRAGVTVIRPHDLRHASATLLLKAGVYPKVVSERLGHSNVNITLNIYSRVSQTLQQEAAEKLGQMLHRRPPGENPRTENL